MGLRAMAAGMPRSLAYQAILNILEGTAKLLREYIDRHPAVMGVMVTTPAGTTIKGADGGMESHGVKSALMHTVEEAHGASKEIGMRITQNLENIALT